MRKALTAVIVLGTDFLYFRHNSNVLILRNPGARFWTIPLRALPAGSEPRFL